MKKRMNQKGFAMSILVYTILGIFLVVTSTMMISVRNSQSLNNTVKEEIMTEDIEVTASKILFDNSNLKSNGYEGISAEICKNYDHLYDHIFLNSEYADKCENGVCPTVQCALDYLNDILGDPDE